MIERFKHKGLRRFWETDSTKGIQASHAKKLRRMLTALQAATGPGDLNHPTYQTHPLKGTLSGHWSMWVNGNWRVTFRFEGSNVTDVDYLDYH